MLKRFTVIIILFMTIYGLFGCAIEEESADNASAMSVETFCSPSEQTEYDSMQDSAEQTENDPIPSDSADQLKDGSTPSDFVESIKLTVDDAIKLVCEKLHIEQGSIVYQKTDLVTGEYVFEYAYNTFFVDPVSGDFKEDNGNLGKTLIINLLGIVKKSEIQIPVDKSIEDIVTENIKNLSFDTGCVPYSAKKRVPYFTSVCDDNNQGGLVIDNEYIKLSELGISDDDLNVNASHGFEGVYFVDVDNDGSDELCSDFIAGSGLYPYTAIFKLDKTTNKYIELSIFNHFYNELNYLSIEFFKIEDITYTVIYDLDTKYQIYKITTNEEEKISTIAIIYPSYDVEANDDNDVLQFLRQKFAEKLPYVFPKLTSDYLLMPSDSLFALMDEKDIDEYSDKSYILADLDNDGSDEVFFQWTLWSQTKLGSTLFFNAYSVFKLQNGQYELYDTNKDSYINENENKKLSIIPNGSEYPLNIFFECYDGNTYMCIIDKGYSKDEGFDTHRFDIVTVYLVENDLFNEIGTIDIVYKPQIKVNAA